METRKARLDAGEIIPLYSKRKYHLVNQRLQALINDYDNRVISYAVVLIISTFN